MRQELESVLAAARTLPPEELPAFLGGLEEIKVTAMLRLSAPASTPAQDELLDIQEAAARLSISQAYLYRHHQSLPFARRIGRRVVFSSAGITEYLRRRK